MPEHYPQQTPLQPRRLPALRCLVWLQAGWRMFIAQPLEWVLMSLVAFVLLVIAALFFSIPVFGQLLVPVLLVLIVGGMLHAAQRQEIGHTPRFHDLLEGVRNHPRPLLLLGVLFSLPLILMVTLSYLAIIAGLLFGVLSAALGTAIQGVLDSLHNLMFVVLGTGLTFLTIWGLILLSVLFAPSLVMFRKMPAWQALTLSLSASLHNLGAMLLFALLLYVLFVLAMIPAGLGILVLMPVSVGALYQAYLDVLGDVRPELPLSQDV